MATDRVKLVALRAFQGEETDPDTGRLVRHAPGDTFTASAEFARDLIAFGRAARAGTRDAEGALRRWGGK